MLQKNQRMPRLSCQQGLMNPWLFLPAFQLGLKYRGGLWWLKQSR